MHFFYQTRKLKKGSSFAARTAALAQSYQMDPVARPPPPPQGYAFAPGAPASGNGNIGNDELPAFDHARARDTTEKDTMPEWMRDEEPPRAPDNNNNNNTRREPGGYAL